MLSIKSLYKIGHGPSSSHTMGPARAIEKINKENPSNDSYHVVLFNSLALTGKGHLTEDVIIETVYPKKVTFSTKIDLTKHANTMIIQGYKNEKIVTNHEVLSVGGGRIIFVGEDDLEKEIYSQNTFKEIKEYCQINNLTLFQYVLKNEEDDFLDFLKEIWDAMKDSINKGLKTEGMLPGSLKIERKANKLYNKKMKNEPSEITENRLVSSYAFAVSEENASGGMIVTAPTCGACGVLPAVLYYMKNKHKFISEEKVLEALAVAGLIGNLIKHNASISGAVAGCQAEIGSACSMAAAAHATLFNLSIDQVEYAAEIAMEHHLGLTCDPINGYVQIPCIERNAVAALRAIDACGLAYFLTDSRKISFDMVVKTMYQTGLDMHVSYKETSQGGLAVNYNPDKNGNCW